MSFDEIISDFPELDRDDIVAVIEWSQQLIVAAVAAYDAVALIPSRAVPWNKLHALGIALGDPRAIADETPALDHGLIDLEAELAVEFGPIPEEVQRAVDEMDWPR